MTASSIVEKFAENGHEIDATEVESRLDVLCNQFKVPIADAENSVVSFFLRQTGLERSVYYANGGDNRLVSISDLPNEDGKWCDFRGRIVDIWEDAPESMTQQGIIGDDTGRTKFVMWKNAGMEEMELGKSYLIENVVTSLYNNRVSVTFNKTTSATLLEEDIDVKSNNVEYVGALVNIQDSSGLIKRCPECKRAMTGGSCPIHGAGDGNYDMRIMGVLDDGMTTQRILLNTELTGKVYGKTLESSVSMAMENMDASIVINDMRKKLVGHYYTIAGSLMDDTVLVETCEVI